MRIRNAMLVMAFAMVALPLLAAGASQHDTDYPHEHDSYGHEHRHEHEHKHDYEHHKEHHKEHHDKAEHYGRKLMGADSAQHGGWGNYGGWGNNYGGGGYGGYGGGGHVDYLYHNGHYDAVWHNGGHYGKK